MAYLWHIMVSTFQNSWECNKNNSLLEIVGYMTAILDFETFIED